MASFVKSMDRKHLLTVGEEGYSSLNVDGRVFKYVLLVLRNPR